VTRSPGAARGDLLFMTPTDIEAKVREITAQILKRSPDDVKLESRYREDLGADSLALVELIYEVEQAFDLVIPDDRATTIRTVGDAVRALQETVAG
jgi:acyl carrier protein